MQTSDKVHTGSLFCLDCSPYTQRGLAGGCDWCGARESHRGLGARGGQRLREKKRMAGGGGGRRRGRGLEEVGCVCVCVRGALLLVVLLLSAARIGAKFHRRACAHADRSLQAGRPAMLGEREGERVLVLVLLGWKVRAGRRKERDDVEMDGETACRFSTDMDSHTG